jgi:hypothetical protein
MPSCCVLYGSQIISDPDTQETAESVVFAEPSSRRAVPMQKGIFANTRGANHGDGASTRVLQRKGDGKDSVTSGRDPSLLSSPPSHQTPHSSSFRAPLPGLREGKRCANLCPGRWWEAFFLFLPETSFASTMTISYHPCIA